MEDAFLKSVFASQSENVLVISLASEKGISMEPDRVYYICIAIRSVSTRA